MVESADYIRRSLCTDDAAIYEYFRPETVRRLSDDHLEGRANRRLLLWSLLSLAVVPAVTGSSGAA
jgi:asparagine synthase (glutamine-hydrolysing)